VRRDDFSATKAAQPFFEPLAANSPTGNTASVTGVLNAGRHAMPPRNAICSPYGNCVELTILLIKSEPNRVRVR
jgi:hypothetical protein